MMRSVCVFGLCLAACSKQSPGLGPLGDEAITGWTRICSEIGGRITATQQTAQGETQDLWTCADYPNHPDLHAILALDHSSKRLVAVGGELLWKQLPEVRSLVAPALDKDELIALDWLIATSTGGTAPQGHGRYLAPEHQWFGERTLMDLPAKPGPNEVDIGYAPLDIHNCPNCSKGRR